MQQSTLDPKIRKKILTAQRDEITEYRIYNKLARFIKDENNKQIIKRIADDELKHYKFWKDYTQKEIKPSKLKIWFYFIVSVILGITFGIKLMENGEEAARRK